MEYVYTGLAFRFIRYYIALWPVWQERKPKAGDRYGSGTLHTGKFLSGSTFRRQVPQRLQRRQRS